MSGNRKICGQIEVFRWDFLHLNSSAKLSSTITALELAKWVTSYSSWEIRGSKNGNFQTWNTWYIPAIIIDKNCIVVKVINLIILKCYWSVKTFMEEWQLWKEIQTSISHELDLTFTILSYHKVGEIKGLYNRLLCWWLKQFILDNTHGLQIRKRLFLGGVSVWWEQFGRTAGFPPWCSTASVPRSERAGGKEDSLEIPGASHSRTLHFGTSVRYTGQ